MWAHSSAVAIHTTRKLEPCTTAVTEMRSVDLAPNHWRSVIDTRHDGVVVESRQQRRARERAELKAASRRGSPHSLVTEDDLVRGWPAGTDTMIRLASRADVEAMADLVALTGVPLDDYFADALRADMLAGALRTGLRVGQEELMRDIATESTRLADGDIRPLYLRSALPLVADRKGDGIIGTLLAYPPANVVQEYYTAAAQAGPGEQHKIALMGAVSLIKIKAVAVAEHARGQHLGATLLQRCTQVYRQCQFALLYGQMPPGRGLEDFYARQGFEVKEEGERLDLWVIFGVRGGIHADRGERLFTKWIR